MNDLITILIIVGVIISFLNKIFRKQKNTETEETPPAVTIPKSDEWQTPIFEETKHEQEYPSFKEDPVFEIKGYESKHEHPDIAIKNHRINKVHPVLKNL